MSKDNQTLIMEFILLGFQDLHNFQIPFFLLLLIIYISTAAGNLLIIALVSTSHLLRSPMYYFLGHLSACDILISTNVTPNTLQAVLTGPILISVMRCTTQLYFFGASAILENCLLTAMSYDRYLAICDPLHYSSIMNSNLPHYLVVWSWATGFIVALITYFILLEVQFCGNNVIDHFYCDLSPLLKLSCSDTSAIETAVSAIASVSLLQLTFVVITYICIFSAILRISSSIGRQKSFSTCSSHLTVVCMYYGTLISLNITPSKGYSLHLKKVLSLLNTIVTPLFNPLIYGLRNKEIRTWILHKKQNSFVDPNL